MDDFELRKDWQSRYDKYFNGDILSVITATDFLTALTLLSSYKKGGTVSCKKKDVLNLALSEYRKYADNYWYRTNFSSSYNTYYRVVVRY